MTLFCPPPLDAQVSMEKTRQNTEKAKARALLRDNSISKTEQVYVHIYSKIL